MSFRDLYEFAQGLDTYVSRKHIRKKTLELCGVPIIRHAKLDLDITQCRGMYLVATNLQHRIVQQLGTHVIVTARDLNNCWERFIYVKELMHAFGPASEATDSGDKLEAVISEFSIPQATRSPQMHSEIVSYWRAMAVLCPEHVRLDLAKEKAANAISDYDIALKLKIPEQNVPVLLSKNFPAIRDSVLDD